MFSQRPWQSGLRLFVVAMLFAFTGGTALAFQGEIKEAGDEEQPGLIEDGEYESPQFGVGITWSDAWTVADPTDPNVEFAIGGNYDDSVASDPVLGDIVFLVDTESESSVLSLGFSPAEEEVTDVGTWLLAMADPAFLTDNLFLSDDAELVLLDASDDTVAILAREAAPNDDHVVFMQIVTDPGSDDYSFWVGLDMYDADEYENILTSIEDDIDVDGHDIFDVITVSDILGALEGGDEPTEEPPTEEATEEPTEEPVTEEPVTEEPATEEPTESSTEESTEETIIPPFIDETESPDSTEQASPETSPAASPVASPAASPVASSPGLLGDGDYLSPQHDVPVNWTDAWILDPDTDAPVQSFPETGVDALYLTDAATEGAIAYITIENLASSVEPAAMLEAVTNPDYIETVLQMSPDSEVVLSETGDGAVAAMFVDSSGDTPFVSILEARAVDNDTVIFIEIRGDATTIDQALLDSATTGLTVNGDPALTVLSATDILDALP